MEMINYISRLLIPAFIVFVVIYGFAKKVRVYDSFIAGAKEGPAVILKIFPYLLAIFVAVKGFQASGAFEYIQALFGSVCATCGVPVEVFSLALIKPLSGSASTGLFTEIVKTTGPGSAASLYSAVIVGSAETTFYVLAVYLGAVGIRKTRFLVPVCLIADLVGIIIAVACVKLFLI